jgi:general secretion pathway protein C
MAIMVIAIAWQSAKIFWLLYPGGQETVPLAVFVAPAQPSGRAQSPTDIARGIVDRHVFGTADASQASVEVENQEDAPPTNLNLELKGTIVAKGQGDTVAIIAEPDGSEKIYKVGEAVPGGATLHAVFMDRVLFRRAGKLETLSLPRADQTTANATRPTSRRTTRNQTNAGSLQEVINRNPVRLTDVIRPQPVFRDGKQQGYRVYPGRQRQQFSQLGLRPGDMITQINGMALDDPARGMEVFRSLGDATQVSVTVERNGQEQVMTLDTSQLQSLQSNGPAPDDNKK